MSYQGKFLPNNPSKYKGDPTGIIYRSSWEAAFCMRCDRDPNIVEWASEEMCLPYRDPARNNSIHRYFPDYVIKVCKPDGTFQTTMIEIKPKKQTIKPVQPKKVTKQFLRDVVTYATNEAKWNVAKEYCADHKWEFQLITEDDLQIKT